MLQGLGLAYEKILRSVLAIEARSTHLDYTAGIGSARRD
jgi:hypothetical protein